MGCQWKDLVHIFHFVPWDTLCDPWFGKKMAGEKKGRHPFFRWWVLAFFRSWNSEGLLLLRSKLFLLSPAPIRTNTRGGDQNMQGIGCYALKISMTEKTPTPHHRGNECLSAEQQRSLVNCSPAEDSRNFGFTKLVLHLTTSTHFLTKFLGSKSPNFTWDCGPKCEWQSWVRYFRKVYADKMPRRASPLPIKVD